MRLTRWFLRRLSTDTVRVSFNQEAEVERLRALLTELPDKVRAECEAQAKRYNHPEESDYRAGIRWGGEVGFNVAKKEGLIAVEDEEE